MIWKLLRKNISVGQIAGYAVANFVGLAIVLSAIHFYGDVSAMLTKDSDDKIFTEDYLVISKPVSIVNTLTGGASGFTSDEIDDMESQPWAAEVGAFTAADFGVAASVNIGGSGFNSFMFLESIPDDFIDVKPKGWRKYKAEDGVRAEVPIIISKDYLALYNFGFAASRGLPQLTEGLISEVPIALHLSGNGHYDTMRARIVGFSSRLNTIAVPEEFMRWANERYSGAAGGSPSRLIVRTDRPGDPAIAKYLEDNDYDLAGDKADNGRASYFLTVMTSIVITIGAIISALALFILMLSIFLLMQKNKQKIHDLLLLGYSPRQVAAGYYRLIGGVNACVLVLSIGAMLIASVIWQSQLASLSKVSTSPMGAIVAGIVIMAAITAANFIAIYRSVLRNFRQ